MTPAQDVHRGWRADLELAFESRVIPFRAPGTVLARSLHKGPLQVQKALYPEGPETCHIAVLHPPGGIAGGDSLCVAAALGCGSKALLTTPGATKWYRSGGLCARQQLHFSLAGDAVLEWLPRENILFDGANISMSLDVALSAHAKYFGWEILCFGRQASGESWRRGTLQMRTSVRRAERLVWSETAHVDAGGSFANSSAGLAGSTVCGTFLVAGYEVQSEVLTACREAPLTGGEAQFGITRVPGVFIARYLGDSSEQVFEHFTKLWAILRPALSARAACAPRVWAC